MTKELFRKLKKYFDNDDFPNIEKEINGSRFLKLRSISRKSNLEEIAAINFINLANGNADHMFEQLFCDSTLTESEIDKYISGKYKNERLARKTDEDYLIDQLNRLPIFDWGGSHGNSLEKNIVNNYVKKLKSYDQIKEAIEGTLFHSLKGYTLNSWYNHWTSIIIEDIFKDHYAVLPTVGLVKKIDFFINNIPFDLKVTYFPEQLMKDELKKIGFGNELTETKRVCRKLGISIPNDLGDEELKLHLQNKLNECVDPSAKEYLTNLKKLKLQIIEQYKSKPHDLMVWFYENQGEMRFDASNRFFLVLINNSNFTESWKIKRNIIFLKENINSHLADIKNRTQSMEIEFYWKKTETTYSCKSDILFLNYESNDAL